MKRLSDDAAVRLAECRGVTLNAEQTQQKMRTPAFDEVAERDALKAELERYKSGALKQVCDHLNEQIDTLQSELTKARELLREALQIDEEPDLWLRVKAFVENQSAPAAKPIACKVDESCGQDPREGDYVRNKYSLLSDPHCPECGHPDCNGQCFGDDMMGDS